MFVMSMDADLSNTKICAASLLSMAGRGSAYQEACTEGCCGENNLRSEVNSARSSMRVNMKPSIDSISYNRLISSL
jgi:hypothetical protein